MTDQCEHGRLAGTCPLCEANAEIAALRAEVERLRGHLQDSIRAETSGDGSLIATKRVTKKFGASWEISIPGCIGSGVFVRHWPCDAETLTACTPAGFPAWFVPNAMKLAERWRAAFGDGGAA